MNGRWVPPVEEPLRGMKHTDLSRRGDWIETFSGERWWPHDPRVEDVRRIDLPALVQVIRFGGHCRSKRPGSSPFALYSVGQHSVLCAELVSALGGTPFERKCGLMHDGHEIYPPGDVLSPVFRYACPATSALRAMSDAAKEAFRAAMGLPLAMPEIVKRADMIMLATELRDLMITQSWQRKLPDPASMQIEVWSPEYTWDRFSHELDDLWEIRA